MGSTHSQIPTSVFIRTSGSNIKSGNINVKTVWEGLGVWEVWEVWEDLVMVENRTFFYTELSGFDIKSMLIPQGTDICLAFQDLRKGTIYIACWCVVRCALLMSRSVSALEPTYQAELCGTQNTPYK